MSGPVVMILLGDAMGRATGFDGQYLKDFDFEAHDGIGSATMTPDLAEAKVFGSMAEAIAFYKTSPKCRPWRADRRPNRPLTATNWQITPLESIT